MLGKEQLFLKTIRLQNKEFVGIIILCSKALTHKFHQIAWVKKM